MTNIVSGKKELHLFDKGVAGELGHISQVHKILKNLKNGGDIDFFEKRPSGLDCSLNYRIIYNEKRHLDVVLCAENKIKLSSGADVAEQHGCKLVIFLNKNCKPKRIQSILKEEIKERKDGLLLEKIFGENMQTLIVSDKEVSRVIKSIRPAGDYEDAIKKIDFFFILKNGKEVPVQVKSSLFGQLEHKKHCSDVPSLVYSQKFPTDLLKEKVLRICQSYPTTIEHL